MAASQKNTQQKGVFPKNDYEQVYADGEAARKNNYQQLYSTGEAALGNEYRQVHSQKEAVRRMDGHPVQAKGDALQRNVLQQASSNGSLSKKNASKKDALRKSRSEENAVQTKKTDAIAQSPDMGGTLDNASELMKEVSDIMVCGYAGTLTFQRDFVGEAEDMLNQFLVGREAS